MSSTPTAWPACSRGTDTRTEGSSTRATTTKPSTRSTTTTRTQGGGSNGYPLKADRVAWYKWGFSTYSTVQLCREPSTSNTDPSVRCSAPVRAAGALCARDRTSPFRLDVPAAQVDRPGVDQPGVDRARVRRRASARAARSSGRCARARRARGRRRPTDACGRERDVFVGTEPHRAAVDVGVAVVEAERLQPAVGDRPLRLRRGRPWPRSRAARRNGRSSFSYAVSMSVYEPAWISVAIELMS